MNDKPFHIVLVDDEEVVGRSLQLALTRAGMRASSFTSAEEAITSVWDGDIDVVLTDVKMPGMSGVDLLRTLKARKPEIEVLMMSGFADVADAVEAVKTGAYDYLKKPFDDVDQVIRAVRKAAERKRLLDRNRDLERERDERDQEMGIIGGSRKVQDLRRLVATVARSQSTVLIRGESGTGKELVARALHKRSDRSAKPFVTVNCSALADNLLESELFGHVKGAFTGAVQNRRGLFEAANHGTIFLDEIGDISPAVQVRLLRVLQEGEIRKVGGLETERLDVRVLAATNVDLERAVQEGRFRQDLYYRLNVIAVRVAPLRERPEDIPILAHHFLSRFATRMDKPVRRMNSDFIEGIIAHTFPGNVRELENLMERAVVLAQKEELGAADLPPDLPSGLPSEGDLGSLDGLPYTEARKVMMRSFERRYFSALLRRTGGNLTAAAREAGMDRSNFRRALKSSGLRTPAMETYNERS